MDGSGVVLLTSSWCRSRVTCLYLGFGINRKDNISVIDVYVLSNYLSNDYVKSAVFLAMLSRHLILLSGIGATKSTYYSPVIFKWLQYLALFPRIP